MFDRVLIAIDVRAGGRDALVLGCELTKPHGQIVVAAVVELAAAPLLGGARASARRRDQLRDAGEEVYATVGGDPRVRYLPLSGVPLGESVPGAARRCGAQAVVVGQDVARGEHLAALLDGRRSWAVVIAPYGQRFVEPRRIAGRSPDSQGLDLLVVPATALDAELARQAVRPVLVPPSIQAPGEMPPGVWSVTPPAVESD